MFDASEIGENHAKAQARGRELMDANAEASGLGPEQIVEAKMCCHALSQALMQVATHVVRTPGPVDRARIVTLAAKNLLVACEAALEATLADERDGKTEETRAKVQEAYEREHGPALSGGLLGAAQKNDGPLN
jgi:gamma-glutamyl:cysteine ligase YbdK (ATP-grasp superfamily)